MQVAEDDGELKPVILYSFQMDEKCCRGMVDLLMLTTESEVAMEISHQELESFRCLQLCLEQARINVSQLPIIVPVPW